MAKHLGLSAICCDLFLSTNPFVPPFLLLPTRTNLVLPKNGNTLIQSGSFKAEKKQLLDTGSVSKRSSIAVCSLFVRPVSLLSSTGRIKRLADRDFDLKHPIILDARNLAVNFFLNDQLLKQYREGVDYLCAYIQRKYVILNLRSTLRFDSSRLHHLQKKEH